MMTFPLFGAKLEGMKVSRKISTQAGALIAWAALSGLTVIIILGMLDRSRLILDNENERVLNVLFTSLRRFDDFGSAIESNDFLRERIGGAAVYSIAVNEAGEESLVPSYRWGSAPALFDERVFDKRRESRSGRTTVFNWRRRSVIFLISIGRNSERSSQERSAEEDSEPQERSDRGSVAPNDRTPRLPPPNRNRSDFPFFNILENGRYLYIEAFHPSYWNAIVAAAIIFPLVELGTLFLVFYIRRLYLRGAEYRERIEEQKNLVVLGTAASSLAHEIKNPLLSIRLQTGILEKLFPLEGREELGIINQEVERLSTLTYRINDYLRNPKGDPGPCDVRSLLEESFKRLCNRSPELSGQENFSANSSPNAGDGMHSEPILVYADTERLRSVFDNLIRNALESGGPLEEINARVRRAKGRVIVEIYDRGKGIAEEDFAKLFDPFFTRKSAGAGIGLNICQRFVEAAGGTLKLENREGSGAAATIELPEFHSA